MDLSLLIFEKKEKQNKNNTNFHLAFIIVTLMDVGHGTAPSVIFRPQ